MTEDNKQFLNYEPKIEYDEDYKSTYQSSPDISINQDEEDIGNPIDELGEAINSIQTLANGLPSDINNIVKSILDHVDDAWENELKDKEYEYIPLENEWDIEYPDTIDPEPNQDQDPEVLPDPDDFWKDDDYPDVIIPPTIPPEDKVEKEYIRHLTDVITDYTDKLKNTLAEFWTNVLISTYNKSPNDTKFIMNNILLNSSNIKKEKQHLLDLGIKSQIHKNAKIDFYSNLFSREETIIHLKQFKVAYELRLRYAATLSPAEETRTGAMDANILKAVSISADKKYDASYNNLYKYLNSSVLVLHDVLNTYTHEIKSKQILIEGAGINDDKTNK